METGSDSNFCYGCMTPLGAGQTICPLCGYNNAVRQNPDDTLPEGIILGGRFLIGKILGRGGFGVTYLGYDFNEGSRVAIKEYYPVGVGARMGSLRIKPVQSGAPSAGYAKGLEAFHAEAMTLNRFNSPYIVRVRDFFRDNGTAYIVMDYIDGRGLYADMRASGGRMTSQRAVELFDPLIREMEVLHASHLIHRDIKPGNIKVVPASEEMPEHLVLLDFGAARSFVSVNITKTFSMIVTPGFAPIEQYSARSRQGPFTDVYAMCATMYNVISGDIPPASTDIVTGNVKLRPFSDYHVTVPAQVEKAIRHGMELKSQDRTQTMRELHQELTAVPASAAEPRQTRGPAPSPQTSARPVSSRPQPVKKNPMLRIAAAAAALLLLFIIVLIPWGGSSILSRIFGGAAPTQSAGAIHPAENAVVTPRPTDTALSASVIIPGLPAVSPIPPTETPVSPTPTQEPTYAVGEIITFGSFEQDNDLTNGPEPIEWQVLAVEEGRALVISRYGLDTKPYNEARTDVNWGTCSLRAWLNGEFLSAAFSAQEQQRIASVMVQNRENPEHGTAGGSDTQDQLFLLSYDEAAAYLPTDAERQCRATAYAKANGAFVNRGSETSRWWLRTPGQLSSYAIDVKPYGKFFTLGTYVSYPLIVVRPAFWLKTEIAGSGSSTVQAATPTAAVTQTPTPTREPTYAAGEIITFGRYEQDNDLTNGPEPIEWQVLAAEEGRALVISKYALDAKPYNQVWTSVTWEKSSLRKWLNTEFFGSAFDDAEQARIIQMTINNPNNSLHGTKGGKDTTDRIFLLSSGEANTYFVSDESRRCEPSAYAHANGAFIDGSNGFVYWWWLRSPGDLEYRAAEVSAFGEVMSVGGSVEGTHGGVRPVFWLNTEKPDSGPEWQQDRQITVQTATPTATVTQTPTITPTPGYAAGEIITFGQYEQDNNPENGPEPIEWQVLTVGDKWMMLISRYALDVRPYHNTRTDVTWSESSLREWLNGSFFESAFTASEQERIPEVSVEYPGTSGWSTARQNTNDRVFLLSISEAERYFASDTLRLCPVTDYARARGAYLDRDYTWYWLRSPGGNGAYAAVVDTMGKVYKTGFSVGGTQVAVRPVIWLEPEKTETGSGVSAYVPGEKLTVGEHFTWGSYEQDNDRNNGPEPIEWQVLAVEDGRALVISKYGLDARQYNSERTNVTWETSSLRLWLNGAFLNSAFSAEEREHILRMTIQNPDNAEYGINGGTPTEDRIFLLSITEAENCFPEDDPRSCILTDYALSQGAYTDTGSGNALWWWLRSSGSSGSRSAYIDPYGAVIKEGESVESTHGAVRPAFWLDMEADGSGTKTAEPEQRNDSDLLYTAGNLVLFGSYEQDNDPVNGPEPIAWEILTVKDGRALLISRYCLDAKPYNTAYTETTWETCSLRTWLNNDFLNIAFTAQEQDMIAELTIPNPDTASDGSVSGNETADRVFLLSIDEANEYFTSDEARQSPATEYALANGVYVFSEPAYAGWWLRSPTYDRHNAAAVYSNGVIRRNGFVVTSPTRGVRPALWLDLAAADQGSVK